MIAAGLICKTDISKAATKPIRAIGITTIAAGLVRKTDISEIATKFIRGIDVLTIAVRHILKTNISKIATEVICELDMSCTKQKRCYNCRFPATITLSAIKYLTAHSIIELPISDASLGTCLPLLVLRNGEVSAYVAAWARERLLEENVGPAGLRRAVRSIGLFYDYYILVKRGLTTDVPGFRKLIKQFYEARRYGNSFLLWQPVRRKTAGADVYTVSDFSDWCAGNFGHIAINPVERALFKNLTRQEKRSHLARQKYKDDADKLIHLKPTTAAGKGIVHKRIFKPAPANKESGPKTFPPELIEAFLSAIPSIRDKLYFLLLFFGGLRISEPVHLFCTDIRIEPDGGARVVLGHPESGVCDWFDENKRKRFGTRAAFLKERYGMGPRSRIGSAHPLFSGWKGRMHSDEKRAESEVHWIREDARLIFARLHAQYMRTTRSLLPDTHPFYFANQNGDPCTLKSMHDAFEAAVKRIGLSNSQPGVNSHGPRHYYGYYCASILRLSIEVTQKLMGHKNVSSTKVYYSLSNRVAHNELSVARKAADANTPQLLIAPPR